MTKPLQLGALGRDQPGDVEPDRGPDAHGLLQTGLEVGQVLGLVPRDVAVYGNRSFPCGLLDLAQDALVDGGRVEHMPEEGLHCRGS